MIPSVPLEGTTSHHFLTVPAAICAYCGKEYPRDASSPTNLLCAGCRQSHHADAEAEIRRLREQIESLNESHNEEIRSLNVYGRLAAIKTGRGEHG